MFNPETFRITDPGRALDLADAAGFGTLVSCTGGEVRIDHLPFLVDRENHALIGHVARANDHWRHLEEADAVVTTFVGPNGYISPGWYTDPGLVPTWNYIAIHVRGEATLITDPDALRDLVDRLSRKHEAGLPAPWRIEKVPPDQLAGMLRAIVGFRIAIREVAGKEKLGQNRAPADRDGAVAGLRALGTEAGATLAAAMAGAPDPADAGRGKK